MCETLQLNWKLPTTPLEVTSSPLSAITDITTYNKQGSGVARNGKSPKRNGLISLKDQIISRKENLNNNRIISVRNKGNKAYRNGRLITKDNKNKSSNNKGDGKYVLRECSIKKRNESDVKKAQPKKRGPKPRPKPQPMSKYRRKTANLRERERMGEINTAFEHLKEKIPTPLVVSDANIKPCSNEKRNRCEKMTKINVLHIAINYIRALESILDTGDAGTQVYGTSIVQSPRLSPPNALEDNLELLKENENSSNNLNNSSFSKGSTKAEVGSDQQFKSITEPGRYKKRSRKGVLSTPKIGSSKPKRKMDEVRKTNTAKRGVKGVRQEPKPLTHATICEKLNQLQPVKPCSLPFTNQIYSNLIIKHEAQELKFTNAKYERDVCEKDSSQYCSDWTELTPTLEFPPSEVNPVNTNQPVFQKLPKDSLTSNTISKYPLTNEDPVIKMSHDIAQPICSLSTESNVGHVINISPGCPKMEEISNSSSMSGSVVKFESFSVFPNSDSPPTTKSPLLPSGEAAKCTSMPRGNLDTLLSSTATNSHEKYSKDNMKGFVNDESYKNSFVQRKLKNINKTGIDAINCDIAYITSVPWLNNSPSPPIFGRQPSFPDVFGAGDDPDFLFGELTKSIIGTDEGFIGNDERMVSSLVASPIAPCSKLFSTSSGNGSILSSDGSASSPSSDESDESTIMDYVDDAFKISI